MKKEARYKVGDELEVISSKEVGIVKSVAALLGDGYNLYVMDMNGKEKMYSESNLTLIRKKNPAIELDVEEISSKLEVDSIIDDIISSLNLLPSEHEVDVIRNACLLQTFLAVNKSFDNSRDKIGSNVLKNSIYHGVVDGNLDSVSTAFVVYSILSRLNMDVKCVACDDEDGNYYVTNLVLVGDEYYYFDANLERNIYNDRLLNDPKCNIEICCAGLGKKEYEKFFKPMSILDLKNEMSDTSLPSNIALESLDIKLIDSIFGDYYEG